MSAAFPTAQAICEIESRQDEVLRKLDELEKRIAETLAQFGDQRFAKGAEIGSSLDPTGLSAAETIAPLAKAA